MTKNRQKNGSLNRDLLKFLNRYGIFLVPPGKSSCPGGSEYVWQRGPKICAKHVRVVRELFKIFLLFYNRLEQKNKDTNSKKGFALFTWPSYVLYLDLLIRLRTNAHKQLSRN